MTITSLIFLISAGMAAFVYRRIPKNWRNPWLVIISAAFVAAWSWQFVIVLALFALVNYLLGLKIDPASPTRKRWVTLGIAVNILILFLLKYDQFYLPALETLIRSIGLTKTSGALQIILPVGLSFLVVQTISYLLDISNQRLKSEKDFIKFCVYVLYFPKLLSGPVERTRLFLPKLDTSLSFDRPLLERSLALILTGLFRKMVFANPLFNMIPDQAFTAPGEYAGQYLFFWLLAYAFALYNDFAAYTSIVRGVSLWFGIELTNNFNLPYLSRNFTEFWNRWHISLSVWLRDYIFFPFSRRLMKRYSERNHFFNFVLPPIVTMLISGMWHGLSWNLLVWGGLHGVYLIMERVPSLWRPVVPLNEQPRWKQHLGVAVTFIFAALAWVPFRMPLPAAFSYWKGLLNWTKPNLALLAQTFTGERGLSNWSHFNLPNPILILVLAAAIVFDLLQNRAKSDDFIARWPRAAQILFVLILLGFALLAFFSDTNPPFVYQGF